MIINLDFSTEKFIRKLNNKTQVRILHTIELLEEFGHNLRMPHSKQIDSNIFELRVMGSQQIRLIYCFWKEGIMIFYGFVKQTNKMPIKQLEMIKKKYKLLA